MRSRPSRNVFPLAHLAWVLLLPCLMAAPLLAKTSAADEQDRRSRYARLLQRKLLLQREAHLKELQLEMAKEDDPYLVFDLEDHEVRVYVRTTPVSQLPLTGAEMEVLALAEDAATPRQDWVDQQLDLVAKSGDQEAPATIQPPAPDSAPSDEVNPRAVTAEIAGLEEITYPSRYTLLYRQGVAVQVMGGSTVAGQGGWVQEKLERLASLLIPPDLPAAEQMEPVHTWIHLSLTEEQAHALYPLTFAGMRAMVRLPGDPAF